MLLHEEISRIKEMMNINEIRTKFYDYLINDNPDVPEYIVMDVFYKHLKDNPEFMIPGTDDYDFYNNVLKKYTWRLEHDIYITMGLFDSDTIERLTERLENIQKDIPASWIPKDAERHLTQKKLMDSKGISSEPIVLMDSQTEPGKYMLLEGWHRIIQAFIKYPDGFNYPNVYIATI